jgi:hypothetical protein
MVLSYVGASLICALRMGLLVISIARVNIMRVKCVRMVGSCMLLKFWRDR